MKLTPGQKEFRDAIQRLGGEPFKKALLKELEDLTRGPEKRWRRIAKIIVFILILIFLAAVSVYEKITGSKSP